MTKPKVHFIGIGGIGISSLARYFLAQNWLVSGSDVSRTQESVEMAKDGARVKIGHKKSNINSDLDLIVYSQAISQDNPEILEAERLKIPIKTYPEALGELTAKYKTLAVAGSHGKSTTTALLGLIFSEAKLDPTVIIGTKLKEFGGKNFRLGKSKYLIIEADEYKGSFLNYYPEAILITNIDREHLDYYKNLTNVKKSFIKFMSNLNPGGILVLNKDDKNLFSLKSKLKNKKVVWFSLRSDAKDAKHVKQIEKSTKIPGRHNLSNALGAFKLAESLGVNEKFILAALSKYRGAWRRMEYKGQLKIPNFKFQIPVYDDYGHHPTEVRATLQGFREKFPKHRLICVFQPHQIERLKLLFKEFTEAFDEADTLILLDIYKVKGRESEVSHNVSSEKLAQAILKRRNGPKEVIYLPHSKDLEHVISSILILNSAVVVMMGAGDIVNLTPKLLK